MMIFFPRERDAIHKSAVLQYRVCVCLWRTSGTGTVIGWNSSKIILRPNSLRLMRCLADTNMGDLVQREHPKITVE